MLIWVFQEEAGCSKGKWWIMDTRCNSIERERIQAGGVGIFSHRAREILLARERVCIGEQKLSLSAKNILRSPPWLKRNAVITDQQILGMLPGKFRALLLQRNVLHGPCFRPFKALLLRESLLLVIFFKKIRLLFYFILGIARTLLNPNKGNWASQVQSCLTVQA